jgi:hypothetical protein
MDAREARQEKRKEYILSKKRVPCADCGNTFPDVCMDFHHIGEKDKTLSGYSKSSMVGRMKKWSLKKINEELDKCEVLCACCHRIRHSV